MNDLNIRSVYECIDALIKKNKSEMLDIMMFMDNRDTVLLSELEDLKYKFIRIKGRSLDIVTLINKLYPSEIKNNDV